MQKEILLEKVEVVPFDQEPLSKELLIEAYKIKKEEELSLLQEMLKSGEKDSDTSQKLMKNY